MPISHAELITLTCPACGTSHTADIWLIVAPDERPDLVEQIRNGSLHTVTCPQCGQTHTLDAPLLIFRPTAEPPILFAPAQQTSTEQDQQHAAELIGILRQRLGAAWNDAWLGQGLTVVPRPMLLVALTDDPALVQAVNAFLNARTWIDSYREVQAHPELLSDEALAMLDQAIAAARAANNADAVAFFEAHRALLRRCREVGAAAAFAEKIGVSVEQIRGVDAETALPPEVQQMIARITQLNRISDMPERVELCRQALTLVTRATHPRLWAALNVELGNSLVQNPRGERGENLEQAIALYQQALAVITREAMPVEWATTMMNLATAYYSRIRGDRAQNLEEAIAAYRQALEVRTREAMPVEWATTMMNLATAYYSRIRGDRAQNLEEAIAAYRQALEVRTREAMPVEWATTMMNLANAYYSRIRGDRAQNLEEAIAAYRQALEIFTPEGMPDDCRRTARQLGAMYAETGRWEAATGAYDLALQAAEILYGESVSPSGKAAELEATGTLFRSAAYALVRAARPGALRRAVEVAELGRARGLGETLTRDRSDLSIIERDYPDIYERYRTAAEIVRSLERTDRASADRQDTAQLSFTDLANRIRAARADLDAAIEAIRAIPGYEAFLRPPAYAEIAAAAQPGVPLVYLITTPQGSLALIVPDGNAEPEALLLDEFTENDLNNLLLVRTGDEVVGGYLPGQLLGGEALTTALETALPLLGEHLIAPVAQRLRTLNATGVTLIPTGLLSLLPLHAATYTVNGASRCLLDEFDVAYAPSARVLSIAQREQQRRAAKGVRLAGVGNPLPSDETGDWALAELRRGLPDLRQQVQKVLPSLEAAAVQADPAIRKQIQDLLKIWRATLTRLEELAQQTSAQVIKAGSDLARAAALFAALSADAVAFLSAIAARIPPSLTYARSELISILDLLPANAGAPLYEQQATREALWAALSEATMAHFACHGQFGLDDTLDSALLLAQESRLTLRDLVAGDTTAMSNLRLVALSACQTAITDFRRLPDESIGLPGGFLQAGVPAVVGTLWSVNDLSTALLMHRFYELHLHGDAAAGLAPQPPVRALRLAQQWLRDLTYKEMFAYFQRHRQLKAAPQRNLESVPVPGARMPTDLIEEGRALAEDYMLDHPNDRPYANPIFWAAFTFNGTIGGAA
jgi:CHAT domain-containing protein